MGGGGVGAFLPSANARMEKNIPGMYFYNIMFVIVAATTRSVVTWVPASLTQPRAFRRMCLLPSRPLSPACVCVLWPVRIGTASGTIARARKRRAGIPARRMRVVSRWWRASRRWSTSGASTTTFFGLTRWFVVFLFLFVLVCWGLGLSVWSVGRSLFCLFACLFACLFFAFSCFVCLFACLSCFCLFV